MWIYTSTPIRFHGVMLNWLSTGTTLPYLTPNQNPFSRRLLLFMFSEMDQGRPDNREHEIKCIKLPVQ
jgi:hypothetical protein